MHESSKYISATMYYIFSWYILSKSKIYCTSLKCMLQMEGVIHLLEEAYGFGVFIFYKPCIQIYTIYIQL